MCGIMGYNGTLQAAPIIIKGLEGLEYRGYDSAGVGVMQGEQIGVYKTQGSPEKLWDTVPENLQSVVGVGHTRWATHGEPTVQNAHPHLSPDGKFVVVHNGIVENYLSLKSELENEGYAFKSETDTEVIAYLLEKEYKGDVKSAITNTLSRLEGSYALGILCSDYPETIFCARYSSPLFVSLEADGGYLASDVSVLPKKAGRIYKIGDKEIGIITKDELKVFDIDGCRIRKTDIKIHDIKILEGKGEYAHYMLKEIYQQPEAVEETVEGIIVDSKIKLPSLRLTKEKIKRINRIEFVACGSAYHVGQVGAYVGQRLMGIPCDAHIASEYRYKNPTPDESTLVVVISQSGETADTLAALREAKKHKAKIISIINAPLSTIAQESDSVILTKAGKEVAVATTKAFSAQLAVVYALCVRLAYSSEKISKARYIQLVNEIKNLPEKIREILSREKEYKSIADELKNEHYVCFIGRGVDYCAAMEGALKLKEVSYTHCEAYAAGELKHGTISLIEKGTPVIAIAAESMLNSKTVSNIKECKARGAKIICIAAEDSFTPDADDKMIYIPETEDLFSVSLTVIPMQLIAYYTALNKGCSIDKPKNLAKSVTVE